MKRDEYWDSLKFVLIFLVVLGHCIGSYMPVGGFNRALYNSIYTFHMPMFIFVSGMFSQIKDRNKYKLGILRIMETYIVFQLIRAVTPMLLTSDITLRSIASVIVGPRYTLWYLLSLIFWRLMVYFTPEKVIRNYPIWIILICIFISLFGGFIPVGSEFSLQRTMTFLPFFFMGYYAKDIELKKHIAKIPSLLAFAVLLSVFLMYFFILNKSLSFVLMGKATYWSKAEFSPFLLCSWLISAFRYNYGSHGNASRSHETTISLGQNHTLYIHIPFFFHRGVTTGYQTWLFPSERMDVNRYVCYYHNGLNTPFTC